MVTKAKMKGKINNRRIRERQTELGHLRDKYDRVKMKLMMKLRRQILELVSKGEEISERVALSSHKTEIFGKQAIVSGIKLTLLENQRDDLHRLLLQNLKYWGILRSDNDVH